MSDIGFLTNKTPGCERFRVYLNGQIAIDVVEAKAGDPFGYVIKHVIGLDGKPQRDESGRPRLRTEYGRVEIKAIPRSEVGSVIRWR